MNLPATIENFELFAPVPVGTIEALIEERDRLLSSIQRIAGAVADEAAVEFFTTGTEARHIGDLFDEGRATKVLDATMWQRALEATDILTIMPEDRRREWREQIEKRETPPFQGDTVVPTLEHLLAERPLFLAERVDGIFRALSPTHLTNSPWGFGKRMILANVIDQWNYVESQQAGHINDLRAVISMLMGRGEIHHSSTRYLLGLLKNTPGVWHDVDGGAVRLRVYKKGTCHIEIHEDMAWRLNAILALLHPRAIPSEHRRPPQKTSKKVELMQHLIPFPVLYLLEDLRAGGDDRSYTSPWSWSQADKHVRQAAERVIESLGGAISNGRIEFGYAAKSVLDHVIMSGSIPDEKSHQFYPTPPDMARRAVEWAEIGPDHQCLEPSAGQGAIADLLPKDRTLCVEASSTFAEILRANGHDVICQDFLEVELSTFDRIVMNPPYSEGRWRTHVERAISLLEPGGVLVAILPASAVGSFEAPGRAISWTPPERFPGVSIDVVMMKLEVENA